MTKDNAKLLQRWLDAKQADANKMNQANEFYEDMKSRHQAVLTWRAGSNTPPADSPEGQSSMQNSVSGNGVAQATNSTPPARDGIRSQSSQGLSLNPNG